MKYTAVFTIEVEHDYFSLSKPDMLRIVPKEATELVLKDVGLVANFFST